MNEILTYRQAAPYIRKVAKMLKSAKSMKAYIDETESDIKSFKKMAESYGAKNAVLAVLKRTRGNYEEEYGEHVAKLEVSLARTLNIYNKIMNALEKVPRNDARDVIKSYYLSGGTITDTADRLHYSASSVSRLKKNALVVMAEQICGIMIDMGRPGAGPCLGDELV
jgi:DNA-directed RNA polymerase specialized sigma subunit